MSWRLAEAPGRFQPVRCGPGRNGKLKPEGALMVPDAETRGSAVPSYFACLSARDIDIMLLTVEIQMSVHGDEEPSAFYLGNRRIGVIEIQDRWLATQQNYFKILADDGSLYILRQDAASREWEMTLFRAEP